jgi:hypothetical protein
VKKFVWDEIKDEFNKTAVSQIVEDEKKAAEAQVRFAGEVRKLIMRIETIEPLLGCCDMCPKVYIRTNTPNK